MAACWQEIARPGACPLERALVHSICGKPAKRTSTAVDSPGRT
jgi:hypothetical protein